MPQSGNVDKWGKKIGSNLLIFIETIKLKITLSLKNDQSYNTTTSQCALVLYFTSYCQKIQKYPLPYDQTTVQLHSLGCEAPQFIINTMTIHLACNLVTKCLTRSANPQCRYSTTLGETNGKNVNKLAGLTFAFAEI